MKKVILWGIMLIAFITSSFAQSIQLPNELKEGLSAQEVKSVELAIQSRLKAMQNKLQIDDTIAKVDKIQMEYLQDTLAITLLSEKRIKYCTGNYEIRKFAKDTRTAYDKLLNKYYRKLIKALPTESDRKKLKEVQLLWLKFRTQDYSFYDQYVMQHATERNYGYMVYSQRTEYDTLLIRGRLEQLYRMLTHALEYQPIE